MIPVSQAPRKFAVIGAGIAGITCARTLLQAGHSVTVFEKSPSVGGRMATRDTPFGTFDHGAQYFTVRDARLSEALAGVPGLCKPWGANAVRVLDEHGGVAEPALATHEAHWVAVPGMNELVRQWAQPLLAAGRIELQTRVTQIESDALAPEKWQLHTEAPDDVRHVYGGFDGVLLAQPAPQSVELLQSSGVALKEARKLAAVEIAPCWTLMLAFPNATQPGLTTLGPQWSAARSTHHRIAWLARESSKPGRDLLERWTVQASAAWSAEHLQDDPARAEAKLLKAFAEVTGIHATPSHTDIHFWRFAQTLKPLGKTHLWEPKDGIGACGDWCIGHRVEDAFVSGLELALAAV
jgi:hypothetical protein